MNNQFLIKVIALITLVLVVALASFVLGQSNYMAQQQERQSQSDAFTKKFMSGTIDERGRHARF